MIEKLKDAKWSLILASLLYLVLGIGLLVWPRTSNLILCYFVASILTAYGLFNILAYFGREPHSWIGLAIGVICAAFGLYSLIQPTQISDIISTILGIVILVDGAMSLRRDFDLRARGFDKWWIPLLLDAVILVLGVVVIFNPTAFAQFLLQVIGVILIYECLSDLWTIHRLSVLARSAVQMAADARAIEVDAVDIRDDE